MIEIPILEWTLQRCGKFTASDIHKLLVKGRKKDQYFGDTAMTYINETIAQILTGEVPSVFGKSIEWGCQHEYDAVLAYEERTGDKVNYFGLQNPKFVEFNDVSGGSPDGEIGPDILLEIKCPFNSGNHIRYLLMDSPQQLKEDDFDYYCQTQMNLLCCKKQSAKFVTYDPRVIDHKLRLSILDIPRDEELIKEITERINAATEIVKDVLDKIANR